MHSIVPHTVEEAYEVADAALAGDDAELAAELGDLLFQVVFLSLLLEERGAGDLATVARDLHAKLVRRHPHVFGDVTAETPGEVKARWEDLKAEQEGRVGIFHHVPETLPALLLARKAARARCHDRLRLPGRPDGARRSRRRAARSFGRRSRRRRRLGLRRSPTPASSPSSAMSSTRPRTRRGS